MTHVITCSHQKAEVGDRWDVSIMKPGVGYVPTVIHILRVCTEAEYLAFCKEQDAPVDLTELQETRYFYEVQILD